MTFTPSSVIFRESTTQCILSEPTMCSLSQSFHSEAAIKTQSPSASRQKVMSMCPGSRPNVDGNIKDCPPSGKKCSLYVNLIPLSIKNRQKVVL